MKTVTFLVTLPQVHSKGALKEYIKDAVVWWAKGGHPDDPLFDIEEEDVKVKTATLRSMQKAIADETR